MAPHLDSSSVDEMEKGGNTASTNSNYSTDNVKPLALPAAPAPVQIVQVNAAITAPEVYKMLVAAGEAKISSSWFKLAVMGMLAGFYVSFGFSFCAASIGITGSTLAGALSFPTGLLLIVLCGAELYTGNTCYMFTANLELRANWWHHLKIIFSAYWWNLVGSLIIVGLELGGNVWGTEEKRNWVHNIAHAKMKLNWGQVVCKAIIANWLVNLAVYQAFCARDVMGKAIGVWTPITAFVAIGLEHCIANMFIIPMSIYLEPTTKWPVSITWRDFVANNLIPATIGNWIGGAIMVGAFYACVYGETIPNAKDRAWDATLGPVFSRLHDVYERSLGRVVNRIRESLPAWKVPCFCTV